MIRHCIFNWLRIHIIPSKQSNTVNCVQVTQINNTKRSLPDIFLPHLSAIIHSTLYLNSFSVLHSKEATSIYCYCVNRQTELEPLLWRLLDSFASCNRKRMVSLNASSYFSFKILKICSIAMEKSKTFINLSEEPNNFLLVYGLEGIWIAFFFQRLFS